MTATRRPVSPVGVAEVKALETSNPRLQCMSLGPPLGLTGMAGVYCQSRSTSTATTTSLTGMTTAPRGRSEQPAGDQARR